MCQLFHLVFITNPKPLNEQLTQLHKPASKPIQTISQKQTGLFFFSFFHRTKALFCCLGFDRVQCLEPHHLLNLVYKAGVVCMHMDRVLKHRSLKGHPNHQ